MLAIFKFRVGTKTIKAKEKWQDHSSPRIVFRIALLIQPRLTTNLPYGDPHRIKISKQARWRIFLTQSKGWIIRHCMSCWAATSFPQRSRSMQNSSKERRNFIQIKNLRTTKSRGNSSIGIAVFCVCACERVHGMKSLFSVSIFTLFSTTHIWLIMVNSWGDKRSWELLLRRLCMLQSCTEGQGQKNSYVEPWCWTVFVWPFRLCEARDILCHDLQRKKYDQWLRSGVKVPFEMWLNFRCSLHSSVHWAPKPPKKPMLDCALGNPSFSSIWVWKVPRGSLFQSSLRARRICRLVSRRRKVPRYFPTAWNKAANPSGLQASSRLSDSGKEEK